jgi:hypothetical protein
LREISVGSRRFLLAASPRETSWSAQAVSVPGGERFGPECAGATEDAAIERLTGWLEWQHAHAEALRALQDAERIYHRVVTASAFEHPLDAAVPAARREALAAIEAARVRLDGIRAVWSDD